MIDDKINLVWIEDELGIHTPMGGGMYYRILDIRGVYQPQLVGTADGHVLSYRAKVFKSLKKAMNACFWHKIKGEWYKPIARSLP